MAPLRHCFLFSPLSPSPYPLVLLPADRDANVTCTVTPTATPRISITKWELSFTSCFCSRFSCVLLLPIVVLVVVVFYVSLIFLAHIIKVASQVASLPLVARVFLFYFLFFCISFASRKSSLIRFSPAVFSVKTFPQFLFFSFFAIPIFCYENFTKFSLTLALILSATLSASERIALDPKSTTYI